MFNRYDGLLSSRRSFRKPVLSEAERRSQLGQWEQKVMIHHRPKGDKPKRVSLRKSIASALGIQPTATLFPDGRFEYQQAAQ